MTPFSAHCWLPAQTQSHWMTREPAAVLQWKLLAQRFECLAISAYQGA